MDKANGSAWYNWVAYVLSVLVCPFAFLMFGFAGLKQSTLVDVVGFGIVGLIVISVLNTPLTLLVKWKVATHVFYAYHIAVHCLLIGMFVTGLAHDIRFPGPGGGANITITIWVLCVYALSLWGLASRYRKSIQRKRDSTLADAVDPRGPKEK